jgi:hypothetical protein
VRLGSPTVSSSALLLLSRYAREHNGTAEISSYILGVANLQLVFLTLPLFVPRNIHSSPKKVSSCVESGLSIVESIALLVHAKRALRLGFFGSHTPVSGIA